MASKVNVEGASEGTTGNHVCAHTRVRLSLGMVSGWSDVSDDDCCAPWLTGSTDVAAVTVGSSFPRKHARSVFGVVPKYGW